MLFKEEQFIAFAESKEEESNKRTWIITFLWYLNTAEFFPTFLFLTIQQSKLTNFCSEHVTSTSSFHILIGRRDWFYLDFYINQYQSILPVLFRSSRTHLDLPSFHIYLQHSISMYHTSTSLPIQNLLTLLLFETIIRINFVQASA